jgi:hypothetical protein
MTIGDIYDAIKELEALEQELQNARENKNDKKIDMLENLVNFKRNISVTGENSDD